MTLPAERAADVDRLLDAFSDAWHAPGDAALAACCADEVHYEDPLTAAPLVGVGRLARHIAAVRRAVPDLRVEPAGPRLHDDAHVALAFRASGMQTGALGSLPASGRAVDVAGVWWFELRSGRFGRVRAVFDAYALGVQVGLLPRGGTAGSRALLMLRGFGLRG